MMRTPDTDWNRNCYLIVEGDEDFRAWSEGVLRKVGAANVYAAASCNDGLALQEKHRADVVLIDLQLSDLHPVDFMRRIRNLQEEGGAETLIIPTTATADAAVLRQACLVGIQSFIRKPTDADNFLKRVNGALTNPRRFVFGRRYFGPERRLSQTAYVGADRRRTTTKPAATPGRATPAKSPRAAGEANKIAAPTAHSPEMKAAASETPAEPSRSQEPAVGDEPAPSIDDSIVTLIEDVDVAGIVDDPVKQAVEGHLAWLRTGGREGERASLQGSDLHGADLCQLDLSNANLREADLSDADCAGINFQGADLRQANLSHANITDGNLGVAKLRHSTFKNTRLDGANLRGADLAGANFQGASLRETDFTGANLLSTDFVDTDLSRANGLSQAQFNKAIADSTTRLPGGLGLPPKKE